MSDQLPEIKEKRAKDGRTDLMAPGEVDMAEDIDWLIAEVERLRKALEQIADDGVEGYESPQKRIALATLRDEGPALGLS